MGDYYNISELMKRIASLLMEEQGKLNVSNFQMSQRLDIPIRTYCRLINGNAPGINIETLVKIFLNSNISYIDIFRIYDDFT